jgi:hypothetical protein
MKKIKEVFQAGEGFEIIYEDGTKRAISLGAIRGGVSWPKLSSPCYYCVIGRYSFPSKNLKKNLILLAEGEATLPEDLFKQLYEDARKLRCFNFYGEIDEADFAYYDQFSQFMDRMIADRIKLLPPNILDWQASLLGILKYVRDAALNLPKDSILYGQLGRMSSTDQQDSQKSAFYAVNALRCVIGSFGIPPISGKTVVPADYIY